MAKRKRSVESEKRDARFRAIGGVLKRLSKEFEEQYASVLGVPVEEAHRLFYALIDVMKERLEDGRPCSFPGLGAIYVQRFEKRCRSNFKTKVLGHVKPGDIIGPVYRLSLYIPRRVKCEFRKVVTYRGSLEEYHERVWREKQAIARGRRRGR